MTALARVLACLLACLLADRRELKHACEVSGGGYCQWQYRGPEAKTTEVEARVAALICASTDDGRPLTGGG